MCLSQSLKYCLLSVKTTHAELGKTTMLGTNAGVIETLPLLRLVQVL